MGLFQIFTGNSSSPFWKLEDIHIYGSTRLYVSKGRYCVDEMRVVKGKGRQRNKVALLLGWNPPSYYTHTTPYQRRNVISNIRRQMKQWEERSFCFYWETPRVRDLCALNWALSPPECLHFQQFIAPRLVLSRFHIFLITTFPLQWNSCFLQYSVHSAINENVVRDTRTLSEFCCYYLQRLHKVVLFPNLS